MGSVGVSFTVAGDGDRSALHTAIWDELSEVVGQYTASAVYEAAWGYRTEAVYTAEDNDNWGPDGDTLWYWFTDGGGNCPVSARAWVHWLGLAAAVEWDALTDLAERHGLTVTDRQPDLAARLAGGGATFVVARDTLWSAEPDRLFGDSRSIAVTDLTGEERLGHAAALERCRCGMCVMLRPEPEVLEGVLRGLDEAAVAPSAAWYVARMRDTTPEVLVRLVDAGGPVMRDMVPAVQLYAARTPGAWPALMARLPDLAGGARGLALYALAAAQRDAADRQALAGILRDALTDPGEAAEAAADLSARRPARG